MILEQYIPILASVVALAVSYVLFYEGVIYKIDEWDWLRRLLPFVDDEARDVGFYTTYSIQQSEKVGTLRMDRTEALRLFDELDFLESPLAAHKTDWSGRREFASLAQYGSKDEVEYTASDIEGWGKLKRFLLMAFVVRRQLHVTLFWDDEDESVVVTAHWEWSPYNVRKAYKHLRGKDYNVEKGVEMTKDKLTDVKRFEVGEDVSH